MIKCKSCEAVIPPEWVFIIQMGKCAGCGSDLFSKEEKELLEELTAAMERMPNDPQGLAGWLLSNYRLTKLSEVVEPTEKFHKSKGTSDNLAIANNPVKKFLDRTGQAGKIAESKARLAKLARDIADDSILEDEYDSDGGDDGDVEMDGVDEYIDAHPGAASKALVNNSLIDGNGEPLSDIEIEEMNNRLSGDETSGSRALQLQRMKRLAAQQGVASGGGDGIFRRSG